MGSIRFFYDLATSVSLIVCLRKHFEMVWPKRYVLVRIGPGIELPLFFSLVPGSTLKILQTRKTQLLTWGDRLHLLLRLHCRRRRRRHCCRRRRRHCCRRRRHRHPGLATLQFGIIF